MSHRIVEPQQEQFVPIEERRLNRRENASGPLKARWSPYQPLESQVEPIEPLESQVEPVQPVPEKEHKQERHPTEVKTIFDPRSGSGGYGAFTIGYTQIAGRDAIIMGGRGEWIMGHGFGLGMGGYGFINDPTYNAVDDLNYSLAGGYGD